MPPSSPSSDPGYPLPPHPAERYNLRTLRTAADAFPPRRQAVLAWIAHGGSNGAIAGRLGIGEKTVEAELTLILRAFRVSSRIEAAVIWALLADPQAA